MTLTIAVVVCRSCFGQAGPSEIGLPVRADSVARMDSLARVNSLLRMDSLAHADSLARARMRVLPFPEAIDAVLGDFPYNLRHITGELLMAEGEIDNYASIVAVPDAENCIVTRYHSTEDTTASWQAKMFSGGEFGEAARKYEQLYRQLQTCYVRLIDGSIFNLAGVWEPAREGASFTTSTLRIRTSDQRYKEVKVELELVYQLADWAVNINIVSKKPDDEVGGIKGN
jgi:hypothetical protein